MKKLIYYATATLFTLSFSVQMLAQPEPKFPGIRGMRPDRQQQILPRLIANKAELKLTEDQLDKIKTLALEKEELQLKYRNALDRQRLEIKKLMLDRENLDYEKLKNQMIKSSELRTEMFLTGLKTIDRIQSILTPEQQQMLQDKRGNMLRTQHFPGPARKMNRGFPKQRARRPGIRR